MAAKPSLSVVPTPFVIEVDIPPPASARGQRSEVTEAIRALLTANLGASVLFPVEKPWLPQQAAWRLGGKGWVTIRKVEGGYRVWKTAEPQVRA